MNLMEYKKGREREQSRAEHFAVWNSSSSSALHSQLSVRILLVIQLLGFVAEVNFY
jgi:hypothetical protein